MKSSSFLLQKVAKNRGCSGAQFFKNGLVHGMSEEICSYSEVRKLKVELDWLEEVRDQLVMMRRAWIELGESLAVAQQYLLAGVLCRTTLYAQRKPAAVDESDLLHSRLIDDEDTWHPFCDSRMLALAACPPEVRRNTRDGAIARNRLAAAWAGELCIPHVRDTSPLAEIVQSALPAPPE